MPAGSTLAHLGKTNNGVVSVASLGADEELYYPLHYELYTPPHHFAQGKADPQVRTKRQIAAEWARRAMGRRHSLPGGGGTLLLRGE